MKFPKKRSWRLPSLLLPFPRYHHSTSHTIHNMYIIPRHLWSKAFGAFLNWLLYSHPLFQPNCLDNCPLSPLSYYWVKDFLDIPRYFNQIHSNTLENRLQQSISFFYDLVIKLHNKITWIFFYCPQLQL